MAFNDEQLRIAENLWTADASLVDGTRSATLCGQRLTWKVSKNAGYLHEMSGTTDSGRSVGPRSEVTEARYNRFIRCRDEAEERVRQTTDATAPLARICRSLKMPILDRRVGQILRQFDVDGLPGSALIVISTNAMPAHELEAQSRFATGLDATNDADFAWRADSTHFAVSGAVGPIMKSLRAVDCRSTIND